MEMVNAVREIESEARTAGVEIDTNDFGEMEDVWVILNKLQMLLVAEEDRKEMTLKCDPLSGYFDNGSKICNQCPKECTACISPTICTECEYHNYLSRNNTCIDKCSTKLLAKDQ